MKPAAWLVSPHDPSGGAASKNQRPDTESGLRARIRARIQGPHTGSGYRVRVQGPDTASGYRVRIQGPDTGSAYRVRIQGPDTGDETSGSGYRGCRGRDSKGDGLESDGFRFETYQRRLCCGQGPRLLNPLSINKLARMEPHFQSIPPFLSLSRSRRARRGPRDHSPARCTTSRNG